MFYRTLLFLLVLVILVSCTTSEENNQGVAPEEEQQIVNEEVSEEETSYVESVTKTLDHYDDKLQNAKNEDEIKEILAERATALTFLKKFISDDFKNNGGKDPEKAEDAVMAVALINIALLEQEREGRLELVKKYFIDPSALNEEQIQQVEELLEEASTE